MKKRWNIVALIILLLQVFAPTVGVAEALQTNEGFILKDATINNDTKTDPAGISLMVFGDVETTKAETAILEISSNVSLSNSAGAVLDGSHQQVGTYEQVQQQIIIKLNAGIKGPVTIELAGILTDSTITEQNITLTSNTKSIVKTVTLPAAAGKENQEQDSSAADSSATNTADSSTAATDSSVTVDSSVKEPATNGKAVKRDPVDISQFFPSDSGSTSIIDGFEVLDENGNPVSSGNIGDYFKFHMDFNIPEDIRDQMQGGDYFEFQLPDEIKVSQNQTFTIYNEDGVPYATVTVGTDGKVVITFTDKITEESDITGDFEFEGQFDKDNIDGPGDIHIDTPFVDKTPGIDINIKPDVDSTVSKEGAFDKEPNPNKVIWNVDVNKALDEITNASVTEHFPDGLTYDSVKVYTVDVDFEGNVIPGSEKLVDPSEYTVDADGSVTFKNKIDGAYRLAYETTIDEDHKPGPDGGQVKFENKVDFDGDEIESIPAESTVTGDYNKALEKNETGYNPDAQTFDWTIKYNYNEGNIKESQATVTDTINSNMSLEDGSVVLNKVTFDDKGNPVEGPALVEGVDYILVPKADGSGFDIQFIGDVDYAVNIHYTTKIDEIVDADGKYANTVEDGSGNKDTETGDAKQQGIVKNVDHVDNNAKIIEWAIDVNKNNYEMENWTLTDQLSDGLTLLLNRFVIEDVTTGKTLENGVDYTLTYDESTNQFKVVFLNNYVLTSDTFKIHYQTKYEIDKLPPGGKFTNDATSDWVSTTDNTHKNPGDTAEVKPNDESYDDGFKFGDYNAVDKKITWTLGVNYNRVPLKDAVVTDPMTGNQKYVPDSLKVFRYQIAADGRYTKGAEITGAELAGFKVTEPSSGNNNTLTIGLPDGTGANQYMFEYQTTLEGEIVNDASTYTNVANVANDGSPDYTITGEVSIAHGGSLAEKSGAQDEDGFVNWSVTVNPSQSTINDVVVSDNPSTNQVIDEKSIIVYETTVAPDGTIKKDAALDPSKYHVVLTTDSQTGLQHLEVTFDGTLTTSYILEYRSIVFLEGNSGTVNNDLTISGNNQGEVTGGDDEDVTVHISEGGGTVVGTKGTLTIRKVNENKEALAGAKFELWDKNNLQKLREGQVGANGELMFGAVPYGDYLLKKVQAPAGYTIPDDLVAGRKVTVSKASTDAGEVLDIEDPESAVTLLKEAANETPLAGATFKLEILIGTVWTPIRVTDQLITDATGKLVVKGLDVGHYRFTEIGAPLTPKEYVLNTTPIEFDVTRNNSGQILPVTVGPYFNYLGSVVFEKQDAAGNPLANAEFTVKRVADGRGNAVNETIATGVKSDSAGKVNLTDLSPGVYEVTETKAPNGYVLNTDKLTFTIASQASGPVNLTNAGVLKNYQGSIHFVKTDDAGKALAGAVFEVRDKAGNVIQGNLTSNSQGEISVTGLAPGDYDLVEVKAPTGYILNSAKTAFTIAAEAAGEPAVVELADQINYQGSIKFEKVNSEGEPLKDAEFTLHDSTGAVLGVYKTDDQGMITINKLVPGDYTLVETKAPLQENGVPYIKNEFPIAFTIPSEANGVVETQDLGYYQNFRGKLVLSKEDGNNGGALAGATFELYRFNADGTISLVTTPSPLITDANGALDYGTLSPGFYKLVEVKAPAGHVINTNPIYFVVTDNESNDIEDHFTFKNYTGSIEFEKRNEAGDVLKDAEFKIVQKTDADGNVVNKTIVEGLSYDAAKGLYYYSGLKQGTYELTETKAATGYQLNTQPVEFEITPAMNEAKPLELDDFINYQGSISFIKADEAGNGLAGAEFGLYTKDGAEVKDESGKAITATSKANGKVTIDNLAPGDYILKELKAPAGYLLNQTEIPFTIAATNSGKPEVLKLADYVDYQGAISLIKTDEAGNGLAGAEFGLYTKDGAEVKDENGKAITAISKANGAISIENLAPGDYILKELKAPTGYLLNQAELPFTIADTAMGKPEVLKLVDYVNYQGSISLIKTDKAGNGLAGAEFGLYTKDGTEVKDKNGKAITATSKANGEVTITDLAPGDYVLKELKAPTGYLLNQTEVPFTIVDTADGKPEVLELADYVNYKNSISFVKTDKSGAGLAGAEFGLYTKAGIEVEDENGKAITVTSEAAGKVTITDLAPGDYVLKELKSPTGYMLNQTELPFTIADTANGQPEELVLGNFINYQGSISLIKTDKAGKGLAGAEFGLYTKAGKAVEDKNGKAITATSKEDGQVSIGDLAPGDYILKELKAPTGYLLNQAELPFTIADKANGQPEVLKLADYVNYQGSAKLLKVDAANQQTTLSNAVFKLVDAAGKVVREQLKTNAKGEILVENLAPGTYQFIETKAPTGYQLSTTPYQIVIPAKADQAPQLVTVTATNQKEPENQKFPQTGEGSGSINTLWFGLILLGLSSLIVAKGRRKVR